MTSVDRAGIRGLRLGSAELLRLELVNWPLGGTAMQVLMAETTAADAGVDQLRITRAAGRRRRRTRNHSARLMTGARREASRGSGA